jgi:hypothetical protein
MSNFPRERVQNLLTFLHIFLLSNFVLPCLHTPQLPL